MNTMDKYFLKRDKLCQCIINYRIHYNDLCLLCLHCKQSGGSLGNSNHTFDCRFKECIHGFTRKDRYLYDFKNITKYSKPFRKNLRNDLINKQKELNKKLCDKTCLIILKKTGQLIPINLSVIND